MRNLPRPALRSLGLALVTVAWMSAMHAAGADSALGQWVSNAGLVTVTAAAGASCLLRARAAGPARRAWVLLGCGALTWGAGQLVWTFYESVQGRTVPFPSAADAGYLCAVPLLATGLLLLPSSASAMSTRLRLVLDGLVIALSLAMVSWELVLADTIAAGGQSMTGLIISLLYPVGDVVCGTVALVALARARHGSLVPVPALLLLCAGSVAFAVGDSGFAYLTLHGGYYSGHLIDSGWFVGFALLGVAARVPPQVVEGAGQLQKGAHVGVIAPYVAVVAAVGAGVTRHLTLGRLGPFLAWGMMTLVSLLVVRQVLALQENAKLTRGLEDRVVARTTELAGRDLWFRSLMQNLSDVVTVVDESGAITYVSPSSAERFGHAPEDLVGLHLSDWWIALDAARLAPTLAALRRTPGATEVFCGEARHADGHAVPVEATVTSLRDGRVLRGFVLNVRDVTERRRLERELSYQAFHDSLTGLANRALFADRVGAALVRRELAGTRLAVLFLDLNGFKAVNDTLGHDAGDRLLQHVAQLVRGCVGPADTVARLGGDEFALLLEDLPAGDDGGGAALRIADALRAPVDLGGRQVRVSCSCGVAFQDTEQTAEELLRNADLAMYRAKADSSLPYVVYQAGMHAELVAGLRLEDDLRLAIDDGQIEVWYQPTFSIDTGTWVGCEALARWRHADLGDVPPTEFIAIAESTGLIVELGARVLRAACAQAAHWRRTCPDLRELTIAVNVSPRQLRAPGFLEIVDAALADAGLPPAALCIELTESVLVEQTTDMRSLLAALKDRGVRLAIDDFGTGYSSLSYLHRFPVDVLKVDRSFVSGMVSGSDEEELTRTIVRLAHSLGLTVVAEGIETPEELRLLKAMSCDLGQGFLYSRPRPAHELEADVALRGLVPSQRVDRGVAPVPVQRA